jgi:guanylate kinase
LNRGDAMTASTKPPRLLAGPGRLIVLSGPSGVGKDTVLVRLFELDPALRYSVSYTTRSPRPGEVDGDHYSFLDEATFQEMAERNDFLEWAEVHGHLYGTSLRRVSEALQRNEDVVLKIDVQGAARVRRRVAGEAIFIFLLPPSEEELHRRLQERATESAQDLQLRLQDATSELSEAANYDYRIINSDVDAAAREILDLINKFRESSNG